MRSSGAGETGSPRVSVSSTARTVLLLVAAAVAVRLLLIPFTVSHPWTRLRADSGDYLRLAKSATTTKRFGALPT